MRPIIHLIFGILFSSILFLLFPSIKFLGFFLIIILTVIIDFDHYFYYFYKKRDFRKGFFKRAYKWYIENNKKAASLSRRQKKKVYSGLHIFHGIEILILTYVLYLTLSKFFLFVFIGFSFHLFLDLSSEIIRHGRTDKISAIYSFLRSKKMKFIDEIHI